MEGLEVLRDEPGERGPQAAPVPRQPGPGVPGIKGLGAPRRGSLACQGRGATREPREARGGGPGSQAKMAVN